MNGVEGEQVGGGLSITAAIVDVDKLNAGTAPQGPKHQAADAAKAVDADFHGAEPTMAVMGHQTLNQHQLIDQLKLVHECSRSPCGA